MPWSVEGVQGMVEVEPVSGGKTQPGGECGVPSLHAGIGAIPGLSLRHRICTLERTRQGVGRAVGGAEAPAGRAGA